MFLDARAVLPGRSVTNGRYYILVGHEVQGVCGMERFMEVIRSDALVTPDEALDVFSILVPILEVAPGDEEAVDAARAVIGRLPVEGVLQPVLDWWFVITTGSGAVTSGAYRLPDELGTPLTESMEALLHAGTDIPAAQWLAATRALKDKLAGLGDHLTLDFYGKSKLPDERDAWASLLERLEPTTAALRSGSKTDPAELDMKRLHSDMRAGNIDDGSRRWREMERRATEAVTYVNECVELSMRAQPWVGRPKVASVSSLPDVVSTELGELGPQLLGTVLKSGPDSVDSQSVADRLEQAGRGASERDRVWLATIANEWMAKTGVEVPVLSPLIERLSAIEERVSALDGEGLDTDEIKLTLLDHDLDEAERLLSDLVGGRRRVVESEALERQMSKLRDRLSDAGLEEEEQWAQRLQGIEAKVEAGELDAARSLVGALERDFTLARRESVLDEAEELLGELERLKPPGSVLYDLRAQLSHLRESPDRRPPAELLPGLHKLVADTRDELYVRARDAVARARSILDRDRSLIPDEDLTDLELSLATVDDDLEEGDPVAALDGAIEVLHKIDARRVRRWTADEGEAVLLDHLAEYCQSVCHFDNQDVLRLHVALKTKPFVILAGLTGSGKSTIGRLYAEALGATSANGRFRRIAVRPDWIDQSEVLGFVNPTSHRFEPGWLAETIRECERSPDLIHFVLLDEMNLAPVEQYMAEILSAMEEVRAGAADVRIPLYSRGSEPENADEWEPELRYPTNLLVVGTVNVDETTRPLSDRVIDRANVLQLRTTVTRRHHESRDTEVQSWHVSFGEWRRLCCDEPDDAYHDLIEDVTEILRGCGVGVGMRAHVELERFLSNAAGVLRPEDAFDWGLLQRIIPKVRGFKRQLVDGLEELREELEDAAATRACSVLDGWLDPQVSDDEFLDGTDARLALMHN